ncbi:MAG: thymidine phosphorylase, partial [Alphaproteobacteria bacterium]|nr:thymidine phosphorylase [Alphaproteobacteria bacterium]
TATVESIPLITASILSKKLAAGLQHLVLDVKMGSGAFMATMEEASGLAESLVAVANGAGLKTTALITDMDEPLAPCAGNAIEVAHACDVLMKRTNDPRVMEITLALGAELLVSAGIDATMENAITRLQATLDSGKAAEHFDRMVALLGGPKDFVANHDKHLTKAPIVKPVFAESEGSVSAIRTRDLGVAVIELGGGRRVASDKIDHRVGLSGLLGKGVKVDRDTPLCMIHAADEASFERAAAIVKAAYTIGEAPPPSPCIHQRIAP